MVAHLVISLLLFSLFFPSQAGGRAAEKQQIGRYNAVLYTLLEYNIPLGRQWYSPAEPVFIFSRSICPFINGLYNVKE